MIPNPNTEAAVAAFHAAGERTALRSRAMALIAAALACDIALEAEIPPAALDKLTLLLSLAGGVLLEHGGPLDLATPMGSA